MRMRFIYNGIQIILIVRTRARARRARMTPEIHRAALRAAAKLALSAAVFGCGGATSDTTEPTTTTQGDDTSAGESALKRHPHHDAGSVQTYCNATHAHKTEEQCCKAEVASATFPTRPQASSNPDLRVDALTR